MAVSVVMATYNRAPMLPRVVAPLLADPATAELVVVVDGCDDGSVELLQELAAHDPRLRPVWKPNGGAVAAQQAGVEAAREDVVLVIDDDVVAEPGLVGGHARHQEGRDDLVVVGYMPTAKPERRRPGTFVSELYHRTYEGRCRDYETEPDSILIRLWGGNVSMPRRALLANGGIGGAFGMAYHFDWELGLRLAKTGLDARFDRTLAARHLHERSYASFRREARNQGGAMWLIDAQHGDLVHRYFIRERYRRLQVRYWLVRAGRRPRARSLIVGALDLGVRTAGRVRLFAAEEWLAAQLAEVEREHGIYLESVRHPAPPRWLPPAPLRG